MEGVGSFLRDCRALYISDIRFDRNSQESLEDIENEIRFFFSVWGQISSIRVLPKKYVGFVKFEYRGTAEFAKEATSRQPLRGSKTLLVKWAYDDPSSAE